MVVFINFDFRGFKYFFCGGKLKNIFQRLKSTVIKLFTTTAQKPSAHSNCRCCQVFGYGWHGFY